MKNIKPIILNSLLSLTIFSSSYPVMAQTPSLSDDTKILSDILVNQGQLNHQIINSILQISTSLSYSVISFDNCILSTEMHVESNSDGNNHQEDKYTYSYSLRDIADIIIEYPPKDSIYYAHDTSTARVNIKLNHSILSVRTLHNSTMKEDSPPQPYPGVAYSMKNLDDAKRFADTLHNMSLACGAPKPAAKQNAEDLPDEEQAHYKQVLTHGKPALMYSTALDMADEGHTNLALQMLQALIEKYPDDAYAAKAIDKKEALRSQTNKSPLSGIRQSAPISSPNLNNGANNINNNDKLQRVQACQSSCQTTKNSCDMTYSNNMGTQLGNTINGLRGHNAAAAQQAGSQILGDPNACQNEYDACTTRCGG